LSRGDDVLPDGTPLSTVSGRARRAVVRAFHPAAQTVYRVRAVDAAGNVGKPSPPIVVVPTKRPADVPKQLPRWALRPVRVAARERQSPGGDAAQAARVVLAVGGVAARPVPREGIEAEPLPRATLSRDPGG